MLEIAKQGKRTDCLSRSCCYNKAFGSQRWSSSIQKERELSRFEQTRGMLTGLIDDWMSQRCSARNLGDMNNDQEISIPQGPITRTRAKKLQQTLYSYIQAMVSSSKKILEDVGDLPYMLCKVELQDRDELNAL